MISSMKLIKEPMKICNSFRQQSGKILASTLLLLTVLFASGQNVWRINNPYEEVDWTNDGKYKACLHAHTTCSDGWMAPQEVVDRYSEMGYSILSITDHNAVTWPWTAFSELKASETATGRIADGKM